MQKRILILSVVVNGFFLILFVIHVQKNGGISYLTKKLGLSSSMSASKPNRAIRYEYYIEKKSLFEILPKENDEIIFIGSSEIDGCEWSELFQNPKIKNRGIGGDNTYGVLQRIEEIIQSKPRKIFVLIGFIDLAQNIPIDSIIINYDRIIDKIKSISPETQTYAQALLPLNKKFDKSFLTNEKIETLNERLKNLCTDKQITFIDLYSHFLDSDNNLNMLYSVDGQHLIGKGYLVWKSLIQKYVN